MNLRQNAKIFARRAALPIAALGIFTSVAASNFHSAQDQRSTAVSATAANSQNSKTSKLSFDVASVKQDTSGEPAYRALSNFPLGLGESYSPNGGLFSATNFSASTYIGFAYKLTSSETRALQSQLPKWANEQRFDIQARAPENTTKDQMRLMMQSLLADRFKLVVHTETKETPVLALILAKAGEIGPQLHPHTANSAACGGFTLSPSARQADGTPSACDVFLTLVDSDRVQTSARNVSMRMIAGSMPLPGMGALDRPVVDQTGLTGTFDFTIVCAPEASAGPSTQASDTLPTFLEALKDQLGLKLSSTTATIDTLFTDRIEQPSPN